LATNELVGVAQGGPDKWHNDVDIEISVKPGNMAKAKNGASPHTGIETPRVNNAESLGPGPVRFMQGNSKNGAT
jgi:hypothetical protein